MAQKWRSTTGVNANFLQRWGACTQIYIDLVPDLLIIFEFRPKGSDTNSTVFVLHYWTLSTGPSTDGPSGRTVPGVDRQLLKVTDSS